MACCNAIIAFDASLYHVHIIKKNIYTSRLQLIKGMMHGSPYCSILEKIFSGKLCPNSGINVFTCTFWDEPQRVKGPNKGNLYSYTSQSYKSNLRSSGCLKPVHQFLCLKPVHQFHKMQASWQMLTLARTRYNSRDWDGFCGVSEKRVPQILLLNPNAPVRIAI